MSEYGELFFLHDGIFTRRHKKLGDLSSKKDIVFFTKFKYNK